MRKLFVSILLWGLWHSAYADDPSLEAKWSQPHTPVSSPETSRFEKYLNHEISEVNGLPDISIPLYNIEIEGMVIPIALKYHASGIQYDPVAMERILKNNYNNSAVDGTVGAGWSLTAGGYRVSQKVRGYTDFSYDFTSPEEIGEMASGHFEEDVIFFGTVSGAPRVDKTVKTIDTQHDIYTYILGNTNGNFIIDLPSEDIINMEPTTANVNIEYEIEDHPEHEDYTGKIIDRITITDGNGFRFNMGTNDDGERVRIPSGGAVAWPVNSITTPNGREVKFSHDTIKYFTDYCTFTELFEAISSPSPRNNNSNKQKAEVGYPKKANGSSSSGKVPTVIETPYEKILFHYINNRGQTLLDNIKIYDIDGNLDQTIKLAYSQINGDNWHFTLRSVTFQDARSTSVKSYKMDYYGGPQYGIYSTFPDIWGFYSQDRYGRIENTYPGLRLPEEIIDNKILTYFNGSNFRQYEIGKVSDALGFALRLKPYIYPRSRDNMEPHSFSLKSITFPTGGRTEYYYEPNCFEEEDEDKIKIRYGAGQRVKKIVSDACDGTPIVTTEYRYGKNEDGIGKINFHINATHFTEKFISLSTSTESENMTSADWVASIYSYSTNPVIPILSEVLVNYKQVSRYSLDESGKEVYGKIVSDFNIPENKYKITQELSTEGGSGIYDSEGNNQDAITEYRLWVSPSLAKKSVYNSNNRLLKRENYSYSSFEDDKYYNGISTKLTADTGNLNVDPSILEEDENHNPISSAYEYLSRIVARAEYKIFTGGEFLESVETEEFAPDGSPLTKQKVEYTYDQKGRILSEIRSASDGVTLSDHHYYPTTQKLIEKNIIDKPVSTVKSRNGVQVESSRLIYNTTSHLPQRLDIAKEINRYRTLYTFDSYDAYGNLQQYTDAGGTPTTIVWSYKGRYPVIEAENATVNAVNSALSASSLGMYNIASIVDATFVHPGLLSGVAQHSGLKGSLITTYDYKPGYGVTRKTEPNGNTTFYEYDDFGRLATVRNADSNKVQEYEYKHANQ